MAHYFLAMVSLLRHSKARKFLAVAAILPTCAAAQLQTTTWTGTGNWISPKHWSHGLPSVSTDARIRRDSDITIPRGSFTVARLDVGTESGDNVRASLQGGHLLIRQDSLIVGERSGSSAEFDLNSGILESVMDIFVGGASASAKRMNHSLLRIRGGRLTGLSLTIGEGLGSNSTVEIIGSAPQSISALEFVEMHAQSDPDGTPAVSTLSFMLDDRGVTPITRTGRAADSTSTGRLSPRLNRFPRRTST
jgi:hypothetical protein